jgi:hypothetical protein
MRSDPNTIRRTLGYRLSVSLMMTFLLACSPQDLQNVLGGGGALSNEEVVSGLKEALRVGTQRGVAKASSEDGFWNDTRIRIPFPPEAIAVRNTLMDLGMNKAVEDFETAMNKAAELAAREAGNVFFQAVNGMTIQDGFAILQGGERAATDFLQDRTRGTLRERFKPIVERATSQVTLGNYWQPLASAYNTAATFTGRPAVDPDLDGYVTERALDGLFLLLAEEERRIRVDPMARTTAILQRVFGQQQTSP